jgi:hypothetical protein
VSLNADEIDIDEWDAFSQHFGVYTGGGRLVSTLRVVGTERTQAADILTKLSEHNARMYRDMRKKSFDEFPMLSYLSGKNEARSYIYDSLSSGKRVVEVSRQASSEYRSKLLCLWLCKAVLGIGIFGSLSVDIAVISCPQSHERFYTSIGFDRIVGANPEICRVSNISSVCLKLTPDSIPVKLMPELKAMATRFGAEGELVFTNQIDSLKLRMDDFTQKHQMKQSELAI